MRFLGLGEGMNFWGAVRHLVAMGGERDFEEFEEFLKEKYGGGSDVGLERIGDGGAVGLFANGRTALAAGLVVGLGRKLGVMEEILAEERVVDGEAIREIARRVRKKLGRKPRVGVNGLTCYAVVQGVLGAEGVPVFMDLGRGRVNFDEAEVCARMRAGELDAVVVQHNLGEMVRMGEMVKVAREWGVLIVEDLAHAVGLQYDLKEGREGTGRRNLEAGSLGEVVVLSFGKGKAVDVCGGGAVVVREELLGSEEIMAGERRVGVRFERGGRARMLMNLQDRMYPMIGWNVRKLMGVSGKLGRGYLGMCVKLGLVRRSAEGEVDFGRRMSFWQARLVMRKVRAGEFGLKGVLRRWYVVRERERVLVELERAGFYGPDFWYEKPVAPERYLAKSGYVPGECQRAEWVAERIVNLPGKLRGRELAKFEKIIKKYEVEEKNEKE